MARQSPLSPDKLHDLGERLFAAIDPTRPVARPRPALPGRATNGPGNR